MKNSTVPFMVLSKTLSSDLPPLTRGFFLYVVRMEMHMTEAQKKQYREAVKRAAAYRPQHSGYAGRVY